MHSLCSYIDNKKDHWYSNPIIVTRDLVDLNKIKMSLWPTHKMNHQNAVERYQRRGLLVEQIVKIVKEMDIDHLLYPEYSRHAYCEVYPNNLATS